jgi:hypothetical protein
VISMRRSANVDLPWSMCAMIEKLRMCWGSKGDWRAKRCDRTDGAAMCRETAYDVGGIAARMPARRVAENRGAEMLPKTDPCRSRGRAHRRGPRRKRRHQVIVRPLLTFQVFPFGAGQNAGSGSR